MQDAELNSPRAGGGEYAGGVSWARATAGSAAVHYLSVAPASLREVLITGGLPRLDGNADDVYRATYRRVEEKNRLYYQRYPDDVEWVAAIADYLVSRDVRLPGGGRLTVRRFQQSGMPFGGSDGFEKTHYLLEQAFVHGRTGRELSFPFLRGMDNLHGFDANPIYALLHEPIYCQGEASNWSAQRVQTEFPQFDPARRDPLRFTGEMVYPWMFDDYVELQPLKEAAEILAAMTDWPALYDQDALRLNTVPGAAAVYAEDMYVESAFSQETAAAIPGMRVWLTNEYQHNGLHADGEVILDRLLKMVRGER